MSIEELIWPEDRVEHIARHGVALQCRVTTEDPSNNFIPDYGRLSHYRSASGLGIRLDAGTAFTGAVIGLPSAAASVSPACPP